MARAVISSDLSEIDLEGYSTYLLGSGAQAGHHTDTLAE